MILRATSSEKVSVDFFDALDEIVSHPWAKACESAEYPWEATPSLRANWLKGMGSEHEVTAWASFFGLTRCAKPQQEENVALNHFLKDRRMPAALEQGSVFMDLILTGAAPPLFFGVAYINHLLTQELNPWSCYVVMSLLRHPAALAVAEEFLKQEKLPEFLVHACVSNPLLNASSALQARPEFAENQWVKAMRILHPLTPKPTSIDKASPMEKFAALLRVDWNKKEFLALSHAIVLDDPFNSLLVEHPCLFEPACPPIDHTNPNKAVIEYFCQDNLVKTVHQYYNPLLNYPWYAPYDAYNEHEIFLFSLLVFNHPMLNMSDLFTKPILKQKTEDHYTMLLVNYFKQQMEKAEQEKGSEPTAETASPRETTPPAS